MIDVSRTIDHVAGVIDGAPVRDDPFHHLVFSSAFPADVYAALLDAMPERGDYGRMSGRAKASARTKVDLFPEGVMRLPRDKKAVWGAIGQVLRSPRLRDAWVRRLSPGLERRFGSRHGSVDFYATPILTRDVPGYRIGIHPDTRWKAITVQIYLPPDDSISHVGTVFHRRDSDGRFQAAARMSFVPNTGYAFAVAGDTWHSVDVVGPEVGTRDSIILTYFVDEGWLRVAQNRCKRLGYLARGLGWRRA
ncbi:MAG TPA: hypothetical protein VFD95_07595 [Usitatibacter sp.]|nr:hypothetical protein [Usitatibacter sp.]